MNGYPSLLYIARFFGGAFVETGWSDVVGASVEVLRVQPCLLEARGPRCMRCCDSWTRWAELDGGNGGKVWVLFGVQ